MITGMGPRQGRIPAAIHIGPTINNGLPQRKTVWRQGPNRCNGGSSLVDHPGSQEGGRRAIRIEYKGLKLQYPKQGTPLELRDGKFDDG